MKKLKLNPQQPSRSMQFPSDVLWEIFKRLPIKVLLTCKLVCRDWYTNIIDDLFAELRRLYSPLCPYLFHGKFDNGRRNFLLLELDESIGIDQFGFLDVSALQKIRFKSKLDLPHHKLDIRNAYNGLVYLRAYWKMETYNYYACNLLTAESPIFKQCRRSFRRERPRDFAIGFCRASKQYKILSIIKTNENEYVAEIQTLGSEEWRSLGCAPLNLCSGPYLNGSLHHYDYSPKKTGLWSFKFETEQFLSLPVPDRYYDNVGSAALTVFKSCLCFCFYTPYGLLGEFWLMKEYGVKDSWVRELVIKKDPTRTLYYQPVMQMNNGKILLSIHGDGKLALFDPQTEVYEDVKVPGLDNFKMVACDAKFSRLPWI